MMPALRWLALLPSILIAGFVGFMVMMVITFAMPRLWLRDRVPVAAAHSAFERELQVAQQLGFEVIDQGTQDLTADERIWSHSVSLDAHQCVAIVTAASGSVEFDALHLGPEGGGPLDDFARAESTEPVAQVQGCWDDAQELEARLKISGGMTAGPWKLEWAVLRAAESKVGGNAGLNRGYVPKPTPDAGAR